jgi:hypothetical protein
MIASEKEKQCIKISKEHRYKVIERKTILLRKTYFPIILKPNDFSLMFDINLDEINPKWLIKALYILTVAIFYIILVPIIFFRGLYFLFFNRKNLLSKKIKELKAIYFLDNEVSEIKTFTQLWDDKGLRVHGEEWWIYDGYTKEEQLNCIKEWFYILYGSSNDLERIIDEIKVRQEESLQNMRENNPNMRIKMASIEMMLPKGIDDWCANYTP